MYIIKGLNLVSMLIIYIFCLECLTFIGGHINGDSPETAGETHTEPEGDKVVTEKSPLSDNQRVTTSAAELANENQSKSPIVRACSFEGTLFNINITVFNFHED